jgi:hypothetical protein
MNTHKQRRMASKDRTRTLTLSILAFIITAIFIFVVAPVESAETYTSANSTYPRHFDNQWQSCNYRTSQMDAVYFAGRDIVFFTQESSCIVTRALYFYTPAYSSANYPNDTTSGNVIIYDSQLPGGIPWFKTVVFGNVLYIFYSGTSDPAGNTVHYRTVTVDYGETGTSWKLNFSNEKSLAAGISSAKIRSAVVMNGKLYILYSDFSNTGEGSNWYYISSNDGVTFAPATLFFTNPVSSPSGWWADSAVFMTPDTESGFKEQLMIAYAPGGSFLYYFFFNGDAAYGHSYVNTGISDVRSVRLFSGTAEGYTNNKYVLQVFCATPTGSGSSWNYLYHGEYTPSGAGGDSGQWKQSWTKLSNSSNDTAYKLYEPNWAIASHFDDENADQRMKLQIWYSRGSEYHYKAFGNGYSTLEFRSSTYNSDLLEHASDTLPAGEPGMDAYPIVGIIAGTPPYPLNYEVPTTDSANTSTVVIETSQSVTFQTTWSVTAGTAVSYKRKFGPVEAQAKLSAGVKHSEETTSGTAVHQTDTLRSYNYMSHRGGLAWALYLKPEFIIKQYIVKSYDKTPLAYDGNTDEMRITLITYGPNTTLGKKAFYIDDPSAPIGGTDFSTQIFEGIQPMPFTSDVAAWRVPVTSTDFYKVFMQLPSFSSTQGDQSMTKYVETQTNAVTNGWNAGFSASATAFGVTAEGNVNYSMDFKTTTSMTQSLGFGYAVPPCGPPGSNGQCISDMTVYPYILHPNDDATGYNAPWISDDVRYFQKPKPWLITYWVASPPPGPHGNASGKIEVKNVQGTLFIDENQRDHDKLSARIILNVPPDFSMNGEEWLHLRLGNYFTDSNRLEVLSRNFDGQNLVLQMKSPNPDSSITIRLAYNPNKSLLSIDWDADRIDLSPLCSYRLLEVNKPTAGQKDFGLYLGDQYLAKTEVTVLCSTNEQSAKCNIHSR